MALSSFNSGRRLTTLVGKDTLSQDRKIQSVVRGDGVTAMPIDGQVTVTSTFGVDPSPDSFFRIINTGGAGTTWTLFIRGTSSDPSTPDRDVPDYTKVFVVQAGEVGDELAFRDRIITELNADAAFKPGILCKAQKVTDRAIVHIYSEAFSASGEFYERPGAGDFDVTIGGSPGDGVVVVGFDNMIARSKPVSIFRDIDNPHRLGSFSIFGNVRVEAKDLDDLFIEFATEDGLGINDDLGVNGSGTPVDFLIQPSATTDIFVEELRIFGQGNGIQFKNWLAGNQPLTNGLEIEIKSDDTITVFPVLKTTADIKNKFSFGVGAAGFALDIASGRDDVIGVFSFNNPFVLRVQGSFGVGNDDYIRIRVNDNLSSTQSELQFIAKGFEKEP